MHGPSTPAYVMHHDGEQWRFTTDWQHADQATHMALYQPRRTYVDRQGVIFPTRMREIRHLSVHGPFGEDRDPAEGYFSGADADPWRQPLAEYLETVEGNPYLAREVLKDDINRISICWWGVFGNGMVLAIAGLVIFGCARAVVRGIRIQFAEHRNLLLRMNECPCCHYDLRGSDSGVCPECGESRELASI